MITIKELFKEKSFGFSDLLLSNNNKIKKS